MLISLKFNNLIFFKPPYMIFKQSMKINNKNGLTNIGCGAPDNKLILNKIPLQTNMSPNKINIRT